MQLLPTIRVTVVHLDVVTFVKRVQRERFKVMGAVPAREAECDWLCSLADHMGDRGYIDPVWFWVDLPAWVMYGGSDREV